MSLADALLLIDSLVTLTQRQQQQQQQQQQQECSADLGCIAGASARAGDSGVQEAVDSPEVLQQLNLGEETRACADAAGSGVT